MNTVPIDGTVIVSGTPLAVQCDVHQHHVNQFTGRAIQNIVNPVLKV